MKAAAALDDGSGTWLVRVLYIRFVAFIFAVAFAVAWTQNSFLIGAGNGLSPVDEFFARVDPTYPARHEAFAELCESKRDMVSDSFSVDLTWFFSLRFLAPSWDVFADAPSVFWFVPRSSLDSVMESVAAVCFLVSVVVVWTGRCHAALMLLLCLAYRSIIEVGQKWYAFGWESQLFETGCLCALMCPWSFEAFPKTPAPWVAIYGNRWLILRIMLGAGLIKLRGDECWRDLTCMKVFYETQPVPNPLSIFLHNTNDSVHALEVVVNHFVECVAAFFVMLPQPSAAIGGLIQIGFQLVLISSGNLSFLNWLTIAPSLCCFQDRHIRFAFSSSAIAKAKAAHSAYYQSRDQTAPAKADSDDEHDTESAVNVARFYSGVLRFVLQWSAALTIAYLSIPVVENLLSSRQAMNTSFNRLKLVNTYGAFGSVTKQRNEIVIQGFDNTTQSWLEYDFHCKPGDVRRRPCLISPFHYRLDWLVWFAPFSNYQQNPWLLHLAWKLLHSDDPAQRHWISAMLAHDPFANRTATPCPVPSIFKHVTPADQGTSCWKAPSRVRMLRFHYTFGNPRDIVQYYRSLAVAFVLRRNTEEIRAPRWWKRKEMSEYLPSVSIAELEATKHAFYF